MSLKRLSRKVSLLPLVIVAAMFAGPAAPAWASVCTLADRIQSANTNRAAGFCPAGTSHDVITITEDITLSQALPPITGRITIEGGGHTISGAGRFRIFDVDSGGRLTVKQLTLTDGNGGRSSGGAIRTQRDAQLHVEDSSFRNNTARFGGAIGARHKTSVTIRDSVFEDNSAEEGGAISLSASEAAVEHSRFRQNLATVSGGALQLYRGEISISNSTVFNNVAVTGGGIYVSGGDITLSHLTLLDNVATGAEGAGLRRELRRGSLNLHNNIIAGRSAASLCAASSIKQNVGNLIEDWSCNSEYGGDPKLERVEGPSVIFLPRDDSPVISAGYPMFCPEQDQIGTGRPQGAGCEIGAIESTSAGATSPVPLAGVCTLRDHILAANTNQAVGTAQPGQTTTGLVSLRTSACVLPCPDHGHSYDRGWRTYHKR